LFGGEDLHYMDFGFEKPASGRAAWRFCGWQNDEYGEWEDVAYF
jgi:hypothetical protein